MNTSVEKILNEVKKVIAGKDDVLEKIMMTVLSRGHVLLDDVPGTGKTTTALAFSRALGLRYGRIQFTPDVLPSDIVGFSMYHKESGSFAYQPGAVMTNLLLADEINRTSSKTQSALLEVMEERQVTVDGQTHKLPDPFVVIATQNPVGSAGTQLLPQAQLDRFMVRLAMGYPDFASPATRWRRWPPCPPARRCWLCRRKPSQSTWRTPCWSMSPAWRRPAAATR